MDFYQKIFKGQFDLARRDIKEKNVPEFDEQLFTRFFDALHGKPISEMEASSNHQEINEERSLLMGWTTALLKKDNKKLVELAENNPDNPVAQWLAGSACLRVKNRTKAQEFYQRSVDLEPKNPLFAWSFGNFYLATSPVQFHQMAKWYRNAMENGYSTSILWIIRYLDVFSVLQGTLIRSVIFIFLWVSLAVYPPTRVIWCGFYVIILFLHLEAIFAAYKLKEVYLIRWLIIRALILSIVPIAFIYLWG
jgi:hypothetical protein